MGRVRRFSIELIRRELKVSILKPERPAGTRPHDVPKEHDAQEVRQSEIGECDMRGSELRQSGPSPPECPACASPWFMLPTGDGEEPRIVQRALGKHGIHTLLSQTGELLVCGKSFELHVGVSLPAAASPPNERSQSK